jgi:hypothetical protein
MTRELAEGAAGWARTLVHADDLVPRTCVASLALLRSELEGHKEAAYSNSALLSGLRDSGVLDKGLQLVGAAIASKVHVWPWKLAGCCCMAAAAAAARIPSHTVCVCVRA